MYFKIEHFGWSVENGIHNGKDRGKITNGH